MLLKLLRNVTQKYLLATSASGISCKYMCHAICTEFEQAQVLDYQQRVINCSCGNQTLSGGGSVGDKGEAEVVGRH